MNRITTSNPIFFIKDINIQGPSGRGQYNGHGVYFGPSTASEVFLIFTTQLYQYFSVFFSICTS